MNYRSFVSILLLFITFSIFSQDNYSYLTISKELKENANAVVRSHDILIELKSSANMTITSKRVITILNKNGLRHLDPYASYSPSSVKIKSISAKVYDSFGNEIDKFKKSDFEDYSNSGSNLVSDDRYLALDYTPTQYPFTFVFELKSDWTTTAFIPNWEPIEGYFISSENTTFEINYESLKNPVRVKEKHFSGYNIENNSTTYRLKYEAHNLLAIKRENYAPSIGDFTPQLLIALQQFHLAGVDGVATNWKEFGKWNYDNLLINRNDLSQNAINEVSKLIGDVTDPIEKAKIIYQYVQDKTRYISIQLGIGGWQPMLASDVEKVSYGDCKALTNFTKNLMESQGIKAYHTVLYGGRSIKNMEDEYLGMQGNHMILQIPNNDNPIWLECTSQKVPFGHIANFTDDRDVLVITPEGGRIEHTKVYTNQESYLKTIAEVSITNEGNISAKVTLKSGGVQYNDRLNIVVDSDQKDRDTYYKDYWSYINNLSLEKIKIKNDRDNIEITEEIDLTAPSYTVSVGEKLLITPNIFNRYTNLPPRYSKRKLPFIIQRGFYDEDEYIFNLTSNLSFETLIESKEIKTQFGIYKVSMERLSDTKIKYNRSLEIFKGDYKKEDYNTYRSFIRKIAKADKASFVLIKIN